MTELSPKAAVLDDPSFLSRLDPGSMLATVVSTPELWREGFAAARNADFSVTPPAAVVVCGMGGSGISGDVLAATAATRADVPVVVHKGFDLPRWVAEGTLVVCVSYSGNTEEAVACFDEARERGSDVVVVAGGGTLAERAAAAKVPCLRPAISGMMPRAAFPLLAAELLVIGERAGLVADLEEETEALLAACETGVKLWGPASSSSGNDAKTIAARLAGTRPQIWGQEGMLAVAAMRWKTQLNENAKLNASWAVLPESLHNEIVPLSDADAFVVLRAPVERERIAAAIDVLSEHGAIEATAIGTSDLATLASSALLGDFVSVYVAAIRGVDPTPIDPITRFKQSLG